MTRFPLRSVCFALCATLVLFDAARGQGCGGCSGSQVTEQACYNRTGPEVVRVEKKTVSYKCRNLPSFLSWLHGIVNVPKYKTCYRTTYHYVTENELVPYCCRGYTLITRNTCRQCGRSRHSLPSASVSKLIVGGNPAHPNQYPWMVRLRSRIGSGIASCGGTIIGREWILTAAHCVYKCRLDDSIVIVGDHDKAWHHREPNEKEYKFSEVYVHPNYTDKDNNYDIALIKTKEAIEFNQDVQPACLPPEKKKYIGHRVTVVGWGVTNPRTGREGRYLQQTTAVIKDPKHCAYRHFVNILCAHGEHYSNTCVGDSGGPMMYDEGDYISVIGVASWTVDGCNPRYNFGYSDVTAYLDWIQTTVNHKGRN